MQFQNGVYQPYNPYTYGAQPMQYPQYAPQAPVQPSPIAQAAQQTAQPQAQQPAQAQQTAQTQGYAYTNEIFVTSKEDALNRQVPFNSSVTYLHQDKPFGFQVVTDAQGKKTVTAFRLVECTDEELKEETTAVAKADLSGYATKDDLNAGLADLENKIVQYFKQEFKRYRALVAEDGVDE